MNTNTFMGFGDAVMQATVATPQPSIWDKVNNVITKVVQPAANVYSQIANKPSASNVVTQQPQSTYFPTTDTSNTPPPAQEKDNTTKYLMIGGAVLLAGTGIYFLTKEKGK